MFSFGKDFWVIVKIVEMVVQFLKMLGEQENGDTPDGQLKE